MRRNAGLTLLEVVISSSIFSVVVILALQVLITTTNAASKAAFTADMERRGRAIIETCQRQFLTAKFIGTGPSVGSTDALGIVSGTGNTEIRYQIPVGRDAAGAMRYGSTYAVGIDDEAGEGMALILRFEADQVLKESQSAPDAPQPASSWGNGFPDPPALQGAAVETIGLDINGDGDLADTFVRGRLRRYLVTSVGIFQHVGTVGDGVLLRYDAGTFYSSLTSTERLFGYVPIGALSAGMATEIVVDLQLGSLVPDRGSFVTRRNSARIRFRNRQE